MDPLTAMKQQSQQQQQGGGPPGGGLQTYLGSSVTPASAAPSNPLASAHPLSTNSLANNPLARSASPQPASSNPLSSSSMDPLRSASPAPASAFFPAPTAASVRQPAPSALPPLPPGERVPVTPSHDPLAAIRQQAPTARPPHTASTFSFAPGYNAPPSGSPATTPATSNASSYSSAQSLTSPQPSPIAVTRPAPPSELSEEQRLDTELRAFFGGDLPATKQDELKADKVNRDEAGIVTLAEAGKWREVVKLCEALLQLPSATAPTNASPSFLTTTSVPPHVVLRYHSYLVSALLKLKGHSEAHIALTRVGPFFAPDKLYQSYAEQYGDEAREGSMVPFELHLSRAELGYYEGDVKKTVDALYGLREYVVATIAKREEEGERGSKKHEETADDWRGRYYIVCTKLADYYMMLAPPDYSSAVHMLASLLSPQSTASPAQLSPTQQESAWYQLGRVHLQAGDVDSAAACFDSAAALSASPTSAATSALHQSLIHLSTGQYAAAQSLLLPHLSASPPPSPSLVGNYAMACLYLSELVEARRAVESYLREDAAGRMDGGLLAVLRVLYDIGNMGSKKKLVEALALMYGSDEMEIV